jgi:hypothetical protein
MMIRAVPIVGAAQRRVPAGGQANQQVIEAQRSE